MVIVTNIVHTYNHGKYLGINIPFVQGICMFDGIAEHEVAGVFFFVFFFCECFFNEITYFSICFS